MACRILFVEDDFMTIDAAVSHYELEGHEVEVCDNVDEAFELIRDRPYDLIVLDVMLPSGQLFDLKETSDGRYTGLRFLNMIRTDLRLSRNLATRVILVTNWREEPQVEDAAEKGHAELIRKPLDMKTIRRLVP